MDTNQWRAQYGLRSEVGAALLYFVQQHGGHLGLPEVVESEVVKQLVKEGRQAVEKARTSLRQVRNLIGRTPSVTFPEEAQLEAAAKARLDELDDMIVRVPLNVEQTRAALRRVNEGRSPNRKKEQFKDSLIWEAVLILARSYRVHLVTEDVAFYEPGGQHMASDLAQECAAAQLSITIHRTLADLLGELRESAPSLDEEKIAHALLAEYRPHVEAHVEGSGFSFAGLNAWAIQAFATEHVDQLAVTFTLRGDLNDVQGSDTGADRQASFVASGEGAYDLKRHTVVALTPGRFEMTYLDDATMERTASAVHFGWAHSGERYTELRIRAALQPLAE